MNTVTHSPFCGCSDCPDAPPAKSLRTFKSVRAARMAYTKAEKAWRAKESEAKAARFEIHRATREQGGMPHDDYVRCEETEKRCETQAAVLFEVMRDIYDGATAQGFYISSWHFGVNPTRDLIASNMD